MKNLNLFFALCLMLFISSGIAFADDFFSAASGDWNTGATWDLGIVPTATDNVTILNGHTVTLAAAGTCTNLTMEAGAILSINAASISIPGTSWALDPASTVIFNGPTTVQTGPAYGNIVYSTTASGSVSTTTPTNLTINGNFSITANTFRGISATSGSVTHSVGGNVIIGPGASARLSAVNNSSATSASCTWNIGGNVTLNGGANTNRLILFESAGPHSGTATYNINGNLNVGSGTTNNPMIQLRSSTTANTSNCTAAINIKGNIAQSGDIRTSTGATGTSLIINMNGSTAQQYTGNSPLAFPAGQTCTLQFNNAAGVTLNSMITVNTNVSVKAITGNITASSSNYINGPLSKVWSATGSFTYPVGSAVGYSPVTLNFTSGTFTSASAIAQAFGIKHTSNTSATDYINRYWTVTQSGISGFACNANFVYVDGDITGTETNLVLGQLSTQWNVVGTVNAGTNTLSATGLTSFSDFTGGETGALPVQLASFVGSYVGNNAKLEWSTISEVNNYGFNVQRYDANLKSYNNIGFVAGKGTTLESQSYSFVDENASGRVEYRLEQIDNNGLKNYFGPIFLNPNSVGDKSVPAVFALNQNYPNPFNPSTKISFSLANAGYTTLKVYNILGKEVATLFTGDAEAGRMYTVNFDAKNLTTGLYFSKLVSGNSVEVRKMTLIK